MFSLWSDNVHLEKFRFLSDNVYIHISYSAWTLLCLILSCWGWTSMDSSCFNFAALKQSDCNKIVVVYDQYMEDVALSSIKCTGTYYILSTHFTWTNKDINIHRQRGI